MFLEREVTRCTHILCLSSARPTLTLFLYEMLLAHRSAGTLLFCYTRPSNYCLCKNIYHIHCSDRASSEYSSGKCIWDRHFSLTSSPINRSHTLRLLFSSSLPTSSSRRCQDRALDCASGFIRSRSVCQYDASYFAVGLFRSQYCVARGTCCDGNRER
jgi:hypothetical protein